MVACKTVAESNHKPAWRIDYAKALEWPEQLDEIRTFREQLRENLNALRELRSEYKRLRQWF
jgi:hypothetical protein